MMCSKRKCETPRQIRAPNFTDPEKIALIKVIARYPDLESKETDAVSLSEKKKMWVDITAEYNQHYAEKYCERTEVGLRTCWANLKQKGNKYKSQERTDTLATGGGGKTFKKDDVMEELFKVLGQKLDPCECRWDDDALELPVLPQQNKSENANSDPDYQVFKHLQDEGLIVDWTKNNPKKMKREVSPPLKENSQRVRQSVVRVRQVGEKRKKENNEPEGEIKKDVIVDEEKREWEIELLKAKLMKTKLEKQLVEVQLEMGLIQLGNLQQKQTRDSSSFDEDS